MEGREGRDECAATTPGINYPKRGDGNGDDIEGSEIGILRKEGKSYKDEAKVIGYKSGGGRGDQNKGKVIFSKGH
jgi:hypothetical protein